MLLSTQSDALFALRDLARRYILTSCVVCGSADSATLTSLTAALVENGVESYRRDERQQGWGEYQCFPVTLAVDHQFFTMISEDQRDRSYQNPPAQLAQNSRMYVDLFVLERACSDTKFDAFLSLAIRSLRPHGWIVLSESISSNVDLQPCQRGDSESEFKKLLQANYGLLSSLVRNGSHLRNFVQLGHLAVAQKVSNADRWFCEESHSVLARALAIGGARNLAGRDPDFRQQLLAAPNAVLPNLARQWFPGVLEHSLWPSAWTVLYHESEAGVSLLPKERRGECHLILPVPEWHDCVSEEVLESLYNKTRDT